MFVAGSVPGIAGQPAYFLTAVDKTDGRVPNNLAEWNANPDGPVTALTFSGPTVYAAGTFTAIGGKARNGIAALQRSTAKATDWDPNPDGYVDAITVLTPPASSTATTVYAGGRFTTIGGQRRSNLAALNGFTGEATDWDPNPNGSVDALAITGFRVHPPTSGADTIYAGGSFTKVGGKVETQPRRSRREHRKRDRLGTGVGWVEGARGDRSPQRSPCLRPCHRSGLLALGGGRFHGVS